MPELRRELSLLDATMINAGTMIASAIFIVPATVAGALDSSGLVLLAWVLGGIISLFGALCVAELGAAFPEAGGLFVYLREAFGPVWGFLYGWTVSLVINPASIAAIAVGFATYLGFFVALTPAGVKIVAIASIAALTALNYLGVRLGATTQNVLTFLKVGALLALVALGFLLPGGSLQNLVPVVPAQLASGLGAFGVAMVAIFWAYDGWIEITYVGSEVKNPGRALPISILASTAVVTLIYALANLAFLYLLSPRGMAGSALVASDAAQVVIGSAGAALVAGAILVSTLGANNGIVLTSARIPYAMARGGLFFRWAGQVHERFRTPGAALVAQGAVSAALALTGSYDQLFTYVVFASWVFYGLGCAAVIWLRRTAPGLPRPYRAWGYPVTPVVFIGFAVWLVVMAIRETPREAAVGAAFILAGIPAYAYFRRA